MGVAVDSRDISISSWRNSWACMAGKRGSRNAAPMAQRTTVSPRGCSGSTKPTQPRSRLPTWRLTNIPRRSEKMPPVGTSASIWPRDTTSVTARRAKRSTDCRSLSERDGISSFFSGFEHAQFAALLDAVVDMTPEAEEVLRGGDKGTDDYQPEQKQSWRAKGRIARSGNEHSDGAHLQDHLGLAERGRLNGEAFRGRDIAQPEHGELTADDDNHHPSWNQVHIDERDESGGDQKLVRDGIEQDA